MSTGKFHAVVDRQRNTCGLVYRRFRWSSVRWAEFGVCAACAAKRWARECAKRARLLH